MQHERAHLRRMFMQAPAMIAILRGPDFVFDLANPLFLQTIGTERDIIGKPLLTALPELEGSKLHAQLQDVLNTGEPYTGNEVPMELIPLKSDIPDNIYFNFVYQPIKDDRGNVESIFVHAVEVTERVVARQNKSKDEFIALASHQLRTPATGVKQYLGMLLEGYVGELTPPQRDFLQKAYESNDRQLSTINDLLHIAQIDAGQIVLNRAPCDIVALVRAVVAEQQGNIRRRRQRARVITRGQHVTADVDGPRLRMVLDNLVDNASKYSRDNTAITVSVSTSPTDLIIKVSDHGVGIAQADFAKLFQKFSRIDNPLSIAVGGNGLGLYLARRIVDAHKGVIDVASQLGRGTVFTIKLPLVADT